MKYIIIILLVVGCGNAGSKPKEVEKLIPIAGTGISISGTRAVDTMYQDGEYTRLVMNRGTPLENTLSYIGKIGDREGKILTKEELAFHKTIDSLKRVIEDMSWMRVDTMIVNGCLDTCLIYKIGKINIKR